MSEPTQTVVTDIRISFIRLMLFFIKAGLAAIPAAICVTIVVMVCAALVGAVFGGRPTFIFRQWM